MFLIVKAIDLSVITYLDDVPGDRTTSELKEGIMVELIFNIIITKQNPL